MLLKIEKSLSKIMQLDIDQINVKSKSNDKLGYIGRNEGNRELRNSIN